MVTNKLDCFGLGNIFQLSVIYVNMPVNLFMVIGIVRSPLGLHINNNYRYNEGISRATNKLVCFTSN